MASAWSQLEQMLTCAICLDKFKNPRLLPCQHSFCGDACMEGLVDYARRQIKCPECRAEHRIPYQGVSSLPSNVTLIRFLELHSRITGEEPEPVPTFMEKCSVCGEKVDGVQRCSHCDKKVCPECKEAHNDLLRREITRINGQSKRCLSKMQDFKETLARCKERLKINQTTVRHEIEESCRRLIEDLQAKQKRLIEEVDSYADQEQRTIDKLKVAVVDELETLESNSRLADEKVSNKFPWSDQELSEMKEIYARAMEFVRLFDPDIGDFTRKMRFTLIPEFEAMRRRICEIGELKFGETATALIASSFQYCNATGSVAVELCSAAAAQAAAMAASAGGSGGYSLAHSNSNTNIGGTGTSQQTMLELPSMQNALMRSQSDHRLASQFQQRLKQQQQQQQQQEAAKNGRYGAGTRDYETDSIRSRYAPPRSSAASAKDYGNDMLTRDWPRPTDNDPDMSSFGSSIHFKSAFMRRKEKERQQLGYGGSSYNNDDDDDLTSEASYGGMGTATGRAVRFHDQAGDATQPLSRQQASKLFDCKEVEHGPFSGVPKLEESPHFQTRLHQMGAKAIVDKKHAEEEGKRDKDLVESARQAMTKASERTKSAQRQLSEDEIEKQKRANKQSEQQQTQISSSNQQQQDRTSSSSGSGSGNLQVALGANARISGSERATAGAESSVSQRSTSQQQPALSSQIAGETRRESPQRYSSQTPTTEPNSSASTVVEVEPSATASAAARSSTGQAPGTPPSPAASSSAASLIASTAGTGGGRRNLYGQAVTEKSKRQLSNALQDVSSYSRRRATMAATGELNDGDLTPDGSGGSGSNGRAKRTLRSSMSKQSSIDGDSPGSPGTIQRRRKTLTRGDSASQQSIDSPTAATNAPTSTSTTTETATQPKNYATGSGGHSDNSQSSLQGSLTAGQQSSHLARVSPSHYDRASTADQTSTTTDDDVDVENLEEEESAALAAARRRNRLLGAYSTTSSRYSVRSNSSAGERNPAPSRGSTTNTTSDNEDDGDGEDDNDDDDGDDDDRDGDNDNNNKQDASRANGYGRRNSGNRRSREMLPNSVNKLLDRSAQIRRDSQEQRSRGDSPQRTVPTPSRISAQSSRDYTSSGSGSATSAGVTTATPTPVAQSSYYSSRGATSGTSGATGAGSGYSSSPGTSAPSSMSSATRTRLAYQRSQSIRDSQQADDDTTNSSNSSYTTASSGSHISVGVGRKSSAEDDNTISSSIARRSSGNSSDRTLTSEGPQHSRTSAYRRESSGDSPATSGPAYQSRFLSRSRTSAAISGAGSAGRSHLDSFDRTDNADSTADHSRPETTSTRSYLSSRDRFMQSVGSPTSSTSSGSNLYSRSGASAVPPPLAASRLGQYRHQPSSPAHYIDNSPFIEFDDEDDEYSAYFPSAGIKTHSEYLRNKFGRRSSSHSSNSSVLLKSRSSHAAFAQESNDDDEDNDDDNDSDDGESALTRVYGLRRSSLAGSFDSQSGGVPKTVYSNKKRMLFKLGSRGSDPGNFTWPRGVAVGMGLRGREIVVADSSNHRVQIFDSNGKFLNEFGSYGSAQGEFDCLAGVAINRVNKNYVVSDRYNHRVQVFDMTGRFVRAFGEFGREPGKFNLPWGVACDNSGLIYVCDKENHRIQVFDADGTNLNKFGICGNQAGQLQHPHYIAVGNGKVVVTDTNNHRVQVFNLSGRMINTFGKEGSANGQFKFPRGVAMDEQGHLIVGDSGNNRLQIFNYEGTFVKSIGTWGSANGEFKGIEGVAVDTTSHNILVCDRENHRIQVF